LLSAAQTQAQETQAKKPPNIVLLVGDDMSMTDVGAFGSEIATPNIDSLAKEGMLFGNFRTSASCSPTRAMLLTGVDNHRAGLGQMLELLSDNQKGKPGYEGVLNDKVVTIASVLKEAGYHTYMTGKWHLGGAEEGHGTPPFERGFERTFILLEGASAHFSNRGLAPVAPIAHYSYDGKRGELPQEYYSSKSYTDKIIEFIDSNKDDGKPFFAYLAFTAPHVPVQAPKEYIDKYVKQGTYDVGYEKIRLQRLNNLKKLGIIPDDVELPGLWPEVRPWAELSDEEKRVNAKTMAIYAGMIDYLDMSVGRVMAYLKEIGQADNTIVVFFGDNGADGHDRASSKAYQKWFKEIKMDNSYENMGLANSFVTRALDWAQVSNTPFWSEKATLGEGGVRNALVAWYPSAIKAGSRSDAFISVMDIVPTLLDFAGVQHPGTTFKGRDVHAMDGRSFRQVWEAKKDAAYGPEDPIGFEVFGTVNKALYLGDWKALLMGIEPFAEADVEWKLFNIKKDPTEMKDLAKENPDQLKKMIGMYAAYEKQVGYVPAKAAQ